MNPEKKVMWVEALRSGEYEQGRGVLQGDGKFCCLGVLCEVAIKDGVVLPTNISDKYFDFEKVVSYGKNAEDCHLPVEVMEWAGIPSPSQQVYVIDIGYEFLTDINDLYEYTFEEIADLIEANL